MRELLSYCGFDDREAEAQSPRIEKALARLGIGDADIERAKVRVATYYDIELQGVRKILGIFLKDAVTTVLLRDEGREKIVHSCMAPGMEIMGSAIMDHSTTVGLMNPNLTFMVVLGSMFGKYAPVLEAAERQWLRGGIVAHCGMVKSRLGLLSLGFLPRPDLTVTSGFTCEASPKSNELIEEFYGIPACYIDACQDRQLEEYPDAWRATTFAAKSMRRVGRKIREVTGFEVTDAMLWEALGGWKAFGQAMERVHRVITENDPVPLGATHLNLLMVLGAVPFDRRGLDEVVDALDTLTEELTERARQGAGPTPKGAPRVLSILPNHHCDPRLEHLANEMGLAIVASDFQGASERGAAGAGIADPDDPYDALVQHLHGSPAQFLGGRISIVSNMCRGLKVDGVLNHYHVGCRFVTGDALTLKDVVSRDLGIPVLTFEWENFDPRVYDHEQCKAKLEVFKAMMEGAER